MSHLLVLLVMLLGFAGLALSMERHQRDLLGRALSARQSRRLRWLGWAAIVVGLGITIQAFGPGFGLAIHAGHASAAAALVVLGMIVAARRRA